MAPWSGLRLRVVFAGAIAACLVLTASAAGARIGWTETAKAKGVSTMTFTVDTLTFDATGWRAHVSVRNVSHVTIGLRRGFGIAVFADSKSSSLSEGQFVEATTYSKTLPVSLRPGHSWSGTIGSAATLSRAHRIYARIVFGPLVGLPGTTVPVVWTTDHVKPLNKAPVQKPDPGAGLII